MQYLKKLCLVLLLINGLSINAQENKTPKIGLCLSGGGAKGLAHIGLLKLIDSLGIKVDYITGTSMGGVVGGLYAVGYTGKQIDSIAHAIDWDLILSQYVPMNDIYSDEKDEFGRYIGEIPIKNKKMTVTGFIEGQELLNTLMRLTKHVNQISDFNALLIPFKCMAMDIVKVEPVVLDHGNLAISMRATMSIPTVFKPIKVDGKLLVDGGVMVNFPVQQLKEMGADIIIGSYTGGRVLQEKELNSISKLLLQTTSFYGIQKSKDDIALCNIFNNLTDSMKQYGAGDFDKFNRIIEIGNRQAHNALPQLIKLANQQKTYGIVYQKKELIQPNTFFKVEDIVIEPACDNEPACDKKMTQFIMNRITFKQGDSISFKDLEKTIKKIYGTRMFFKVYYILEPQTNGNYIVKLKIEQDVKFRLKGALHYDNESGTGFILNVTARNWLGKGSRLTGTVDLSENLKYRINYRKYIAQSNLSFNAGFLREQALLQLGRDSKGTIDAGGSFNDLYRSLTMGLNYNIAIPGSIYLGVIGETDRLSPKFATPNNNQKPGDRTYITKYLASFTSGLIGQFRFNNLNRYVFPNKGTDFFIENKLVLIPVFKDESSVFIMDSTNNPLPGNYNQHEENTSGVLLFAPYNRLSLKLINLLPVNNKVSVFSCLTMGLTNFNAVKFDTSLFHIKYNYYSDNDSPLNDYFFIGGVEGRSRQNFSSLWGLNEGEAMKQNFATLRLGIQCEVLHKLFITPAIAYYYSATSHLYFFKYIGKPNTNGDTYYPPGTAQYDFYGNEYHYDDQQFNALITYGLNIGYKSPIGPINFNISRNSGDGDKRWRAYISIGYRF